MSEQTLKEAEARGAMCWVMASDQLWHVMTPDNQKSQFSFTDREDAIERCDQLNKIIKYARDKWPSTKSPG